MSNKFFSLIYGESIHIAPEKKVIPSKELSTLMDAKEIVGHVQKDADQYRKEVVTECETQKEQARRDGFEEGNAEWAAHIIELENEIKKVRSELEKVIIPIAVKAAKKIMGRELEVSETTVVDIVANSLKAVSQHKKITIWVNRKDIDILEKHREKLAKKFETLESLSIREREDITQGGCIIETEAGIINAQLENQWMILENAFQQLMQAEKEKK